MNNEIRELTFDEVENVNGGDFSYAGLGGAMVGGAVAGGMAGSIDPLGGPVVGAFAGAVYGGAAYTAMSIYEYYFH